MGKAHLFVVCLLFSFERALGDDDHVLPSAHRQVWRVSGDVFFFVWDDAPTGILDDGSASSSSSSINAKTTLSKINDPTLRRGERVRTFAFGARKAPKGQLPEREPSMGLDPENAQ